MATTTAPRTDAAELTSIESWDTDPIDLYTTPADAAGSVAWQALTHSQAHGPDIARLKAAAMPSGLDAEDAWSFMNDLVEEAAAIGYVFATLDRIDRSGFERTPARTADIARAIAALRRLDVVDDGEAFAAADDPDPDR